MQIKQAKEYFELGIITGFEVVRLAMGGDTWTLLINGKEGRSWMLETQLGETKKFASLDTLVRQIEDITGRVQSLTIRV